MSAAARKKPAIDEPPAPAPPVDPRRLLVACVAFLALESVLILAFGDYFYEGVSSGLGRWGMIGLAALGYLLLGAVSRAPVSIVIGLLPPLLAWYVDIPVPAAATDGDALPLDQTWLTLIYVFLPAWLIGLLGARLVIARREGNLGR